MIASVALTFGFDAGAADEQMQRTVD